MCFTFLFQALVYTLLDWTRATGSESNHAPHFQAFATTRASQQRTGQALSRGPIDTGRLAWNPAAALQSPATVSAGQWDDWSTRLSGPPPEETSSASSPPTVPLTHQSRSTSPATSVPFASIPQLQRPPRQQPSLVPTTAPVAREPAYQQTPTPARMTASRNPIIVIRRKLVVTKPLKPESRGISSTMPTPTSAQRPTAVAYARSTLFSQNEAEPGSTHPRKNSFLSVLPRHLETPRHMGTTSHYRPTGSVYAGDPVNAPGPRMPKTISIPYQVPQRPTRQREMSESNQHYQLPVTVNRSSFKAEQQMHLPRYHPPPLPRGPVSQVPISQAPPPSVPIQRPQQARLPPSRFGYPPSLQQAPPSLKPSIHDIPEPSHHFETGSSKSRRRNHAQKPTTTEHDDFFNSREDPYNRHSDSFEQVRQQIEGRPYTDTVPAPNRRPLFVLPKPIDFGLSKLNEKGCKTTVKHVKQVPKAVVGAAGSDLHSLFRHKRGVPEESKMTSIIMTKECFFPEDPEVKGQNNHGANQGTVPTRAYSEPSPTRNDYLKNHDPLARSTQYTPTYRSYYPRSIHGFPWHSSSNDREPTRASYESFRFGPETFDGTYKNFPPYKKHQNGDDDTKHVASSTAFRHHPDDERGRFDWQNDRHRFGGQHHDRGGQRDHAASHGHGSRPLSSRNRQARRGPPPPKTMNRSFAFYRRDETPQKDRFMESYSTANRKSFKSDYDSDRDGFF